MKKNQEPFWKIKSLYEMDLNEWESLCDGCGICCLEKIEDTDTGEIKLTSVTCEYYDNEDCHCSIYQSRFIVNPDCIQLTTESISKLSWLPMTCAYRCLMEGRELNWWHPLISGSSDSVHQAHISIKGRSISGKYVYPDDLKNYLNQFQKKR